VHKKVSTTTDDAGGGPIRRPRVVGEQRAPVEDGVVALADARVQPRAVVIETPHVLVADLAKSVSAAWHNNRDQISATATSAAHAKWKCDSWCQAFAVALTTLESSRSRGT